jgi:hypothetical protein
MFHKMLENYRIVKKLVASCVVLSSTELVNVREGNWKGTKDMNEIISL